MIIAWIHHMWIITLWYLIVKANLKKSLLHTIISKEKLSVIEYKLKIVGKMQSKFENNKCAAFSFPLARSFIAYGILYCPDLSHASTSALLLCIVNAFLIEIWLRISTHKISANAPSKNALSTFMGKESMNLLEIARQKMKGGIFLVMMPIKACTIW